MTYAEKREFIRNPSRFIIKLKLKSGRKKLIQKLQQRLDAKVIVLFVALSTLFSCSDELEATCNCTTYTIQLVDNGNCMIKDTLNVIDYLGNCSDNNKGGFEEDYYKVTYCN